MTWTWTHSRSGGAGRGRPRANLDSARHARDLVGCGMSVAEACRMAGIGKSTYYRLVKRIDDEQDGQNGWTTKREVDSR